MKTLRLMTLCLATAGLLSGCGGGSDDPGRPAPVVNLGTANGTTYGGTMTVTLSGNNLDQPLTLTSNACRNFAATSSTPTTATYTCTVAGASGAQSVAVSANGVTVYTVPFTVPEPQVSLAIFSGTGTNPQRVGTIVIDLKPDLTPITVDNFLAYVKAGFYNGIAFHRHGRNPNRSTFVLQAGRNDAPVSSATSFPAPKAGQRAPIRNEAGLSNVRYTVSMARTNVADSATSEFFINTANNTFLDRTATFAGYAAFGVVTAGTDVVDAMVAATCNLSPVNFDPPPPNPASTDCVPEPNLVIGSALQTR
jgi:cyclophilin family peptidyl-prolyl cis-trans isomerase